MLLEVIVQDDDLGCVSMAGLLMMHGYQRIIVLLLSFLGCPQGHEMRHVWATTLGGVCVAGGGGAGGR